MTSHASNFQIGHCCSVCAAENGYEHRAQPLYVRKDGSMKYSGYVLCYKHGAQEGKPLNEGASKNLQEAQQRRRTEEQLRKVIRHQPCHDCPQIAYCKLHHEPASDGKRVCKEWSWSPLLPAPAQEPEHKSSSRGVKFIAEHDGQTFQRTSQTHTYNHCIIIQEKDGSWAAVGWRNQKNDCSNEVNAQLKAGRACIIIPARRA